MLTGQVGRSLRALIVLALAGLTAAACGASTPAPAPSGGGAPAQPAPSGGQEQSADTSVRGGTLVMQAGQYPSLDPHQVTYSWTVDVIGPAVNNIVRFDPGDPKDSKV